MKLEELLNEIKKQFQVDETLKAYLYENKIELIDYTSSYDLENGEKLDEFYGDIGTIYLEDNKINLIENSSINLITPANKDTIIYLANLIGVEIEDYNNYNYMKLPSIRDIKTFMEV